MPNLNLSRSVLFALGLALAAPVAVLAQDETQTFPPSTMIITDAEGAETEYQISDLGVYLSTSPAYDDIPATTDFSLSMTVVSPPDRTLLEWAAQTGDKKSANRDVTIIASVAGEDGQERELRYEVSGAHITSVSTSHSSYSAGVVSLSLGAEELVIDGVSMN